MNKHWMAALVFACFLFVLTPPAIACGYDWISDCSSQIHLKINGTQDSFLIAGCPSGYHFDGVQLGSVQSIALVNAKAITWESCQNNVTNVILKYRIYASGNPSASWQSLNLPQYKQVLDGPYTTRYRQSPVDIPLDNGLNPGGLYIMEIYLVAEVDTIGDDFIPETTLLRNNGGANYKFSFIYGGQTAPPLAILAHITRPNCPNSVDGRISISVYGNNSGLFYQWSNINLNFFQQNNLTAGVYGITVTNSLGQTASANIQVIAPPPIDITFSGVQSVGCQGSPGVANAVVNGGTPPYQYHWSNGQSTPSGTFPTPGTWSVTVTDAHVCQSISSVLIENTGLSERYQETTICAGQQLQIGGQTFNAPGQYDLTVPGQGGCDTLIHLNLHVSTPTALVTGTFQAICTGYLPGWLVAQTFSNEPSFTWTYQNTTLATGDSCLFQPVGPDPAFPTLVVTDQFGCTSESVSYNTVLLSYAPFSVDWHGTDCSSIASHDGAAAIDISEGSGPFTVLWSNGDTTAVISMLSPGTYCATVTDVFGCSKDGCVEISAASGISDIMESQFRISPNPAAAGSTVTLEWPRSMKLQRLEVQWLDPYGHRIFRYNGDTPIDCRMELQVPESIHSGLFFVQIIHENRRFITPVLLH